MRRTDIPTLAEVQHFGKLETTRVKTLKEQAKAEAIPPEKTGKYLAEMLLQWTDRECPQFAPLVRADLIVPLHLEDSARIVPVNKPELSDFLKISGTLSGTILAVADRKTRNVQTMTRILTSGLHAHNSSMFIQPRFMLGLGSTIFPTLFQAEDSISFNTWQKTKSRLLVAW